MCKTVMRCLVSSFETFLNKPVDAIDAFCAIEGLQDHGNDDHEMLFNGSITIHCDHVFRIVEQRR